MNSRHILFNDIKFDGKKKKGSRRKYPVSSSTFRNFLENPKYIFCITNLMPVLNRSTHFSIILQGFDNTGKNKPKHSKSWQHFGGWFEVLISLFKLIKLIKLTRYHSGLHFSIVLIYTGCHMQVFVDNTFFFFFNDF